MKESRERQIADFIGRIEPFLDAMLRDMRLIGDTPRTLENTAAWDRANVRAFFSVLEALSNFLRSQAQFLHDLGWKGLKTAQLEKLKPSARLTCRENIKVSLEAIAILRNPGMLPMAFGEKPGWTKMLIAERVRDRITHPKSAEDLVITAVECEAFKEAVGWYFQLLIDCLALERPPWLRASHHS
jgi:hypothetical protein